MENLASHCPALKFLHEDDNTFAVFKPWGLHSVRRGKRASSEVSAGKVDSVADLLGAASPDLDYVSKSPLDAGLVNRLDQMTSGILLGAKNREAWHALHSLFLNQRIIKRYLALVEGEAPQAKFTLQHTIVASGRHSRKVRAVSPTDQRRERSQKVVSADVRSLMYEKVSNCSLVELTTSTGARHQVRAQLSSANLPLVGDSLYGAKKKLTEIDELFGAREFYLLGFMLECPEFAGGPALRCPGELLELPRRFTERIGCE